MTKEDKDLLFKDLSARLPYHVRVKIWLKDGTTEEGALDLEHNYADVLLNVFYYNKIKDIKPYLRPISSMTMEEEKELQLAFNIKASVIGEYGISSNEVWWVKNRKEPIGFATIPYKSFYNVVDWLNAHHFDYRNLIEKGLALEAPEGMYNS